MQSTPLITTFCAIGDVPYTAGQAFTLTEHMQALPPECMFLIHVGDIRKNDNEDCERGEFSSVASILRLSPVPVLIIRGDNDWTDCKNRGVASRLWETEFLSFESRYWDFSFDITRQPGRLENFSFVHQEVLFIGLNIVGGSFESEWTTRLTEQLEWTTGLIRSFVTDLSPRIGRIVLFGHANPNSSHDQLFFDPLAAFIDQELNNKTPFLYVNGDGHYWRYESNFFNQESFLRIMVAGNKERPLKITVQADGEMAPTAEAFVYER